MTCRKISIVLVQIHEMLDQLEFGKWLYHDLHITSNNSLSSLTLYFNSIISKEEQLYKRSKSHIHFPDPSITIMADNKSMFYYRGHRQDQTQKSEYARKRDDIVAIIDLEKGTLVSVSCMIQETSKRLHTILARSPFSSVASSLSSRST